ncbi:DNA-binding transcriptional regulator, MarR family [Devosia sp. YR412]|uniref:MarR family winged helix-turn-helix transcriptional regulator n=1 Tax=Devosia sp. YR412 TaxID=1881030 RepID=UPI0008B3E81A|nr:MarR family transcriptional regulator [Devosia sp. YR412]SEP82790.1 DNA-binding transcriptional regulator, MarR family [Devosia sp. YR412]
MACPVALAELLELTARKLHSRGHAGGLFPAQWVALRYFANAPEALRTASDLARFQSLANGPVSRTVRTMLQKGFVAKAADQPKGRAELLELTGAGQALLQSDPTLELQAVLETLPEGECEAFSRTLEQIAARLP